MCRHLSRLTLSSLAPMRALVHPPAGQAVGGVSGCGACRAGEADLWACLQPDCMHVGCGRRQPNKHAMRHGEASQHPLVLKIGSLDVWCYTCRKFIGDPAAPILEQGRLREIVGALSTRPAADLALLHRRQEERAVWTGVHATDAFFLVSMTWFALWHAFFIGDTLEPPLSASPLQTALAVAVADRTGRRPANLYEEYHVVNEPQWRFLHNRYALNPALPESIVAHPHVRRVLPILRMHLQHTEEAANEPEQQPDD